MAQKFFSGLATFIVRVAIGLFLICFVNQYLLGDRNMLKVGVNILSLLTSGILGIPGVCLLYGILLYQNL